VKIPLIGAGVALAAGLALGAAMQPHLDIPEDRPAGPQLFASVSAARAEQVQSGATPISYRGAVPDYVLGTDFLKSTSPPAEFAPPPEPRTEIAEEAPPPPAPALTRAAYEAPPLIHVYPSLGGAQQWVLDIPPTEG
jgi:hypothetical protein